MWTIFGNLTIEWTTHVNQVYTDTVQSSIMSQVENRVLETRTRCVLVCLSLPYLMLREALGIMGSESDVRSFSDIYPHVQAINCNKSLKPHFTISQDELQFFVCLVQGSQRKNWLLSALVWGIRLSRGRIPRLTSDTFKCCHKDTERGNRDFCLSRSHYTNTDSANKERAPGAGIEPTTC